MPTFLSDLTGVLNTLASKQTGGAVNPYVEQGTGNTGRRGVIYGTKYTPVLTPGINSSASKLQTADCLVTRIGPNVCVSGTIKAGSVLILNAETRFFMELPIASDLGQTLDLSGCGARSAATLQVTSPVAIKGEVEGNRAEFIFNSTSASLQDITFIFQYGII